VIRELKSYNNHKVGLEAAIFY